MLLHDKCTEPDSVAQMTEKVVDKSDIVGSLRILCLHIIKNIDNSFLHFLATKSGNLC